MMNTSQYLKTEEALMTNMTRRNFKRGWKGRFGTS